jgi:hypothetical protein
VRHMSLSSCVVALKSRRGESAGIVGGLFARFILTRKTPECVTAGHCDATPIDRHH